MFSGNMIATHLLSCNLRKKLSSLSGNQGSFLLRVSGKDLQDYWLFLEVNGITCRLKDIDSFLRIIWLECCGHLSSFRINNQIYESPPDPMYSSKSMQICVKKVLEEGMIFEYTYDFGSSTELIIKVVSAKGSRNNSNMASQTAKSSKVLQLAIKKKGKDKMLPKVKLVARNDPIVYTCHTCEQTIATSICTICLYERSRNGASLCENCTRHHKCGEDMILPIINSPRSGECGYTGEHMTRKVV
jgi:hypothetical protein